MVSASILPQRELEGLNDGFLEFQAGLQYWGLVTHHQKTWWFWSVEFWDVT